MSYTGVSIVVNDADFQRALKRVNLEVQKVVADKVRDEALHFQRDIRKQITQNRSVVTGDLRRSINIEKRDRFYYVVGTNLFYAPFVEFGARNRSGVMRAGKPFMTPVYNNRKDKFREDLRNIIGRALR